MVSTRVWPASNLPSGWLDVKLMVGVVVSIGIGTIDTPLGVLPAVVQVPAATEILA